MKLPNRLFIALTVAGLVAMLISVSVHAGYLAFDGKGNLFVSDFDSHSIFKFTLDGKKSTLATGLKGPLGLSFDSKGNLFASDGAVTDAKSSILKFDPGGTKSTFATGISSVGMAFDRSGNLFVSDAIRHSILKFTPDGNKSTFVSGLGNPMDLTFDGNGNLFVSDGAGGAILKITPAGGQSTFVSELSSPDGIAFDRSGNLFVSDAISNSILKFTPDGNKSTFLSGLGSPHDLTFDGAGNLFVSDPASRTIFKIAQDGTKVSFASDFAQLAAEEKIKCASPDGTLALRILYTNDPSGNVETGIIELTTHKVLFDLHGPGRPYVDDAKLVWSADSQRVAFFDPSRRGGRTRVFFRNGASFREIELPTLPEPRTPKKVPTGGYDKTIEALHEPVRWLKSGALVIYSEVEGDYSGRGALEITVGFDQSHKPSVLKSKKITPRPITTG